MHFAIGLPNITDWIALLVAVGSTLYFVCRPNSLNRIAALCTTVGWILLIVLNQHRLQPWGVQIICFIALASFCDGRAAVARMRQLVVSIYIFSGLAKLDFQFAHTVGQDFLHAGLSLVGLGSAIPDAHTAAWFALLMPTIEILIGLGLCITRTRRAALFGATAMHASLIVLLSPIGLNHQPGVLLWNCELLVIAWLLWGFNLEYETEGPPQSNRLAQSVSMLTLVLALAPILNTMGLYDHWLAWGLYAPSNSRVIVLVHEDAISPTWPAAILRSIDEQPIDYVWRELQLDSWSIESLGTPLYPEARFQAGVALAVIERLEIDGRFRAQIQSKSNRFSGRRETREVSSTTQLRQVMQRFKLGSLPREFGDN